MIKLNIRKIAFARHMTKMTKTNAQKRGRAAAKGPDGAKVKKSKDTKLATDKDKYIKISPLVIPKEEDKDKKKLKMVFWNIGSLRSTLNNRSDLFQKLQESYNPEIICFCEHKLQAADIKPTEKALLEIFRNYRPIWACSEERKGYSGVVTLLKKELLNPITYTLDPKYYFAPSVEVSTPDEMRERYEIASCHRGVGIPPHKTEYNKEGRVITLNFKQPDMYMVFAYVPNSGDGLKRLDYRINDWEVQCGEYLQGLAKEKAVSYIGDLNVAHLDSDIWNPKAKHLVKSAGTTPAERKAFSELMERGFVDGFRHFHPDATGHFSYWSIRARNKPHNRGLRLDYTVVSKSMVDPSSEVKLGDAYILPDICAPHGDHCAVGMTVTY